MLFGKITNLDSKTSNSPKNTGPQILDIFGGSGGFIQVYENPKIRNEK